MDASTLRHVSGRELRATVAEAGCLLSSRSLNSDGYRESKFLGRYVGMAHRLVWLDSGRGLGVGLTLDHLCRRRNCLNVEHMEPVTLAENIRRANERRRAFVLARTTCANGHDRTPESTYIHRGTMYCRPCNSAAQRRRRVAA